MKTIQALVKTLSTQLKTQKLSITVAESCTGGGLAAALTDLAGSSDWFDRGFVTYSNAAKQAMLGVSKAILDTDGAVSEACASAMATGALIHSDADYSVSITGIAGPGGGSETKPVGTVWMAFADKNQVLNTTCHTFSGNRHAIREASILAALKGLIQYTA